jgi:hypothetical protein
MNLLSTRCVSYVIFLALILGTALSSNFADESTTDSVVTLNEASSLRKPLDILAERSLYPREVWLGDEEVCKNGKNKYGPCDESRFPKCKKDHDLCFRRARRKDGVFYNNNPEDPYFYIDYEKVYCRKVERGEPFNCSSCTPGTWCPSLNRCTWRPYNNCPDDHRYQAKQKTLEKKRKQAERRRKRAERKKLKKDLRRQKEELESTSVSQVLPSNLFDD